MSRVVRDGQKSETEEMKINGEMIMEIGQS